MPIYKGSTKLGVIYYGSPNTNCLTSVPKNVTSLAQTTVQPLRTGITITNVYKGSTLVYRLGFDPVTFTENGSWVVPTGIKQIRVNCVRRKAGVIIRQPTQEVDLVEELNVF